MLTDKECRNVICPLDQARKRLSDAGGLYLEVSPAGSKRWFLKYRNAGKEMRLALGSYPEVSLAKARVKQAEIERLVCEVAKLKMERDIQKKTANCMLLAAFKLAFGGLGGFE